jgi:hypothetical protein
MRCSCERLSHRPIAFAGICAKIPIRALFVVSGRAGHQVSHPLQAKTRASRRLSRGVLGTTPGASLARSGHGKRNGSDEAGVRGKQGPPAGEVCPRQCNFWMSLAAMRRPKNGYMRFRSGLLRLDHGRPTSPPARTPRRGALVCLSADVLRPRGSPGVTTNGEPRPNQNALPDANRTTANSPFRRSWPRTLVLS